MGTFAGSIFLLSAPGRAYRSGATPGAKRLAGGPPGASPGPGTIRIRPPHGQKNGGKTT
nr:MAG TPA: hypothetical protein [Caudoviricetes sp.]